jgi:cysteine synthase
LGSSIVPNIWRPEECVDRIMPMGTEEAWDLSDRLLREEGLFVGHSAGGSVAGALRIANELPSGQEAESKVYVGSGARSEPTLMVTKSTVYPCSEGGP